MFQSANTRHVQTEKKHVKKQKCIYCKPCLNALVVLLSFSLACLCFFLTFYAIMAVSCIPPKLAFKGVITFRDGDTAEEDL